MLDYVKVGLHQGSVAVYADDLVLMAPTMEQLGIRVAEWGSSLLDKRVKVNAGNTKVMVGSSDGKWSCGFYGKGVQATSGQCTVCTN